MTQRTINLKINGKDEVFDGGALRLTEYLAAKGIRPETVAIEVNLKVIPKASYAETLLREGDEVEIVRFVGGGA